MSRQFSAVGFVGVALVSLPALRWRPCKHCTVVVASNVLALLPTLRWPLCPRCIGIAVFVASALPPASKTGICPITTQLQHIRVRGIVVVVVFLAQGPYPASCHGDLAFDGLADAALVSLLALCWHPCPHPAGIIASLVLSLLPALRRRCCPCCAGAFALFALALLPLCYVIGSTLVLI
jgi:hypothetical protein